MAARRSALGRGLGALIPGAGASPDAATARAPEPVEPPPDAPSAPAGDGPVAAATEIPVDRIDPNPDQPRRVFSPEQLESLSGSLSRHGVLQPVVVRRAGDRYELVVGERRWRAACAAGLASIPAVVSDISPQDRLELALVENVQRHDLNPVELAHAYKALQDAGHTQEEIGQRVGMDRSSIANHLRLLELGRDIQADLEAGVITMGHAKALLQVSHPERRLHLRDEIVKEHLSVREAEQRGRRIAGPAPPRRRRAAPETADPHLDELVAQLRDRLQTRVRIRGSLQRGRIEIDFFGGEDLDRLTSALLDGAGGHLGGAA